MGEIGLSTVWGEEGDELFDKPPADRVWKPAADKKRAREILNEAAAQGLPQAFQPIPTDEP